VIQSSTPQGASHPDWSPFDVSSSGERPAPPRPVASAAGIGDRIRTAAFAELQAREAFNWGADHFEDAPEALRGAWRALAHAEEKHLGWLLRRAGELGVNLRERQVSDQLWISLRSCKSAREFAIYMATAEERGRVAGERFAEAMSVADPVSARIFGQIAEEERAHIALAAKFYPDEATAHGLHKPGPVELGSTPWPGG
jgi:rubrerythrin